MTKLWRKEEWQKRDDELETDAGLKNFVEQLFDENCVERRDCGQREFANVFEYFRTYPVWLKEKYNNRNNNDKKDL
tara:strand:+ start:1131 stop:1358 length:228 start_codon:yes stop_codon:yes gene_type:complete